MGRRVFALLIAVLLGGMLRSFVLGGRDLARLRHESEAANYVTVYAWHPVADAAANLALGDAAWTYPRVRWVEVEEFHSSHSSRRSELAEVAGLSFSDQHSHDEMYGSNGGRQAVGVHDGPHLSCASDEGRTSEGREQSTRLEVRQRAGARVVQFRCRMTRWGERREPWVEPRMALELRATRKRWSPPVALSYAVRELRGCLLRAGVLSALLAALAVAVERRIRSRRPGTTAPLPAAYRTPADFVAAAPSWAPSRLVRARGWIWFAALVGLWASLALARANAPPALSPKPAGADPWPASLTTPPAEVFKTR